MSEKEIDTLLAKAYRDILSQNDKALVANLLDVSGLVILNVDTLEKLLELITGKPHSITTSMNSGDGCKCCGGKTTVKLFDSIIGIRPELSEDVKEKLAKTYKISITRTYATQILEINREEVSTRSAKKQKSKSKKNAAELEIEIEEPEAVSSMVSAEKSISSPKSPNVKIGLPDPYIPDVDPISSFDMAQENHQDEL